MADIPFQHAALAAGKWRAFSLAEQLGNIGSEVHRSAEYRARDDGRFWGAVTRALELFDLTLDDPRWKGRRREIVRVREVFADAVLGGEAYGSTFEAVDQYLLPFALLARREI